MPPDKTGEKTMRVCFFADLHLPREVRSPQYSAFRWALSDMRENKTDLAVFVGDATADGSWEAYSYFLREMEQSGLKYLYIPGNSDLRDPESEDRIKPLASPLVTEIDGVTFVAINDADGKISPEADEAIINSPKGSVLFMHHPPFAHPNREERVKYFKEMTDKKLFFAHVHKYYIEGNTVSLQALDPDKAIGECPALTYYDTESGEISRTEYPCPVPKDIFPYFGITCYRPEEHIAFAAEHGLPCLELRPQAVDMDRARLSELISLWRSRGGRHLSVHLHEIDYRDGEAVLAKSTERLVKMALELGAERLTQHVPRVSVRTVREDGECLTKIARALAEAISPLGDITVGVENMHMTAGEKPDDTRRFGYIPEECLEFMEELGKWHSGKVGINLDIGHARNNAPFSSTYQIGAWLAIVGDKAVGYHVHQVITTEAGFVNHTAITEPYGRLISYASFFRMWQDGEIAKAPMIFEMDGHDAYATTLAVFDKYR